MIDRNNPIFAVDTDDDIGKGYFVRPLSEVIDAHMRSSKKYFTPSSLKDDFKAVGAIVTKQAIYSALVTLMGRKRIYREFRGNYRHANTFSVPRSK